MLCILQTILAVTRGEIPQADALACTKGNGHAVVVAGIFIEPFFFIDVFPLSDAIDVASDIADVPTATTLSVVRMSSSPEPYVGRLVPVVAVMARTVRPWLHLPLERAGESPQLLIS